jgi:GNAT superfamily N-acetyltransferase
VIVMDRPVDIERARRRAKALLRAARAGDRDALARMRSDREPCLADAQHAIAREHGEPSWPALIRRVDTLGRELLDAARDGQAEAVYRLLEQGAPPNARDPESGNTALHLAGAHGRLDAIDYLVGWIPVDRHARNAAGHTALGACITGTADPVVAKVLVSVGLEPEPWMLERASGELAAWLRDRLGQSRDRSHLPQRFGETAWSTGVALFTLLTRSPLAETRVVGDGFAVRTGRLDNTRNGVVCSRLPEQHADDQITSVIGWLRERRAPAQWLLGPQTEPPDLRERLQRAGCQPERTAVHMAARIANLDLSPKRQPDLLEITPIHDPGRLAEALDDPDDARLLTSLGLKDTAPLRHYAALVAGRTVGVVSILIDGPNAEVLELNVNANERRRGIGRTLVLRALHAAAAAGCSVATIGPTPATVPFYESLGLALERYPLDRCYYTPLD